MYPCIRETYGGFFEVVCRSEDRQLTFRDHPYRLIRQLTLEDTL